MKPGIYDTVITTRIARALTRLDASGLTPSIAIIDPADIPARIGDTVGTWISHALATIPQRKRSQAAKVLAERVLAAVIKELNASHGNTHASGSVTPDDAIPTSADNVERLTAISPANPVTGTPESIGQPLTPLGVTTLMTNAPDEPSVGTELLAEIDSADSINIVLAFIRWSGIRTLIEPLRRHTERGRRLRIITTTYTGSTECRALEELAKIGADIRVSYDTSATRLHAKAWLFSRATGFSTVYIGSSNLTFSAQVTGLEWNVRATQSANPVLIEKFVATFESYWASDQFEIFDSKKFQRAIHRHARPNGDGIDITPFEITPYPFQRQILEKLEVERSQGRAHNLVAAATGTGKTVVAALDYKRLRDELGRSRLLFVAHRKEILKQSRATFRHVLRDGSFGELWVDGDRPTDTEHVFASIQSINAARIQAIAPEHFDVVIVDEFHHAAANTYVKLLDHVRPRHLLGLTATPERTDGLDILRWFGDRIAVELRLWDALEQGLLAPFHYFGVADGTDLSNVTWSAGGYSASELTNVYTADHVWTGKVLNAVSEIIANPKAMRALGFCVSINHAHFMADQFEKAGISARAVSANTPRAERQAALDALARGKTNILFAVDLFNEGIDIPAIDTVLMLRPTESATVFLQQLGRGLRRSEGKDVLTVLDFVGNQRKEFRFDQRFSRLLGTTRKVVERELEEGFPHLPAGCQINLDRQSSEIILENIRHAMPRNVRQRAEELRNIGDVGLAAFLDASGLLLEDIYGSGNYWTLTRRRAGFIADDQPDDESAIGRGIGRLLHVDDLERIAWLDNLLSTAQPPKANQFNDWDQARLHMLLLALFSPRNGQFQTLQEAVDRFWCHPLLRLELREALSVLRERISHLHRRVAIKGIPLQVHATYGRDEILAAFGASTVTKPLPLQAGVFWHELTNTDIFFINLDKSDKGFSPSTRYRDFAVSDRLFHWESQANTSLGSETGRRYLKQPTTNTNVALFIRERKRDAYGSSAAYFFAGLADYEKHEGEKPIAITWRLRDALPGDIFAAFRAAVA